MKFRLILPAITLLTIAPLAGLQLAQMEGLPSPGLDAPALDLGRREEVDTPGPDAPSAAVLDATSTPVAAIEPPHEAGAQQVEAPVASPEAMSAQEPAHEAEAVNAWPEATPSSEPEAETPVASPEATPTQAPAYELEAAVAQPEATPTQEPAAVATQAPAPPPAAPVILASTVSPLAEAAYNALVTDFRYQQSWHVYLAANPHLDVQFYGMHIEGFVEQQAAYILRYDRRLAAVEALYAGDDSPYAWLIADLQEGRMVHLQWAQYYETNPQAAAAANQGGGQRQMVALYDQRIALVHQLAANN